MARTSVVFAETLYDGRTLRQNVSVVIEGHTIVDVVKRKLKASFSGVVTPAFIDAHSHIGLARYGEPGREDEVNDRTDQFLPLADPLNSIYFDDAGLADVWLGDSMGEMVAYYTLADLAFIGGSLLPLGGQNLIEAAACGCPVLVGPHTFNFEQATEDAIACGAARRVGDVEELAEAVNTLLSNQEELHSVRQKALTFAATHAGATARTMQLVANLATL